MKDGVCDANSEVKTENLENKAEFLKVTPDAANKEETIKKEEDVVSPEKVPATDAEEADGNSENEAHASESPERAGMRIVDESTNDAMDDDSEDENDAEEIIDDKVSYAKEENSDDAAMDVSLSEDDNSGDAKMEGGEDINEDISNSEKKEDKAINESEGKDKESTSEVKKPSGVVTMMFVNESEPEPPRSEPRNDIIFEAVDSNDTDEDDDDDEVSPFVLAGCSASISCQGRLLL